MHIARAPNYFVFEAPASSCLHATDICARSLAISLAVDPALAPQQLCRTPSAFGMTLGGEAGQVVGAGGVGCVHMV